MLYINKQIISKLFEIVKMFYKKKSSILNVLISFLIGDVSFFFIPEYKSLKIIILVVLTLIIISFFFFFYFKEYQLQVVNIGSHYLTNGKHLLKPNNSLEELEVIVDFEIGEKIKKVYFVVPKNNKLYRIINESESGVLTEQGKNNTKSYIYCCENRNFNEIKDFLWIKIVFSLQNSVNIPIYYYISNRFEQKTYEKKKKVFHNISFF